MRRFMSLASHLEMNWESARNELRRMRDTRRRESEKALRLGKTLLSESLSRLGDELWAVYDQLFVAALDCGRHLEAESHLLMLEKQFPESLQVKTLRGMKMESEEKYEDALQWYDSLLEKNEPNMLIRKRKITVLIAQKNVPDAIKALTEYLELFMSDQEAWLQLSELHMKQMDYKRAAFCVEELLLVDPHNHLYPQHYAELLYTMGGVENLDMARKYFAQSLKINPNNMRALYGFYLACISLPKKKDRDTEKWANCAQQRILQQYKAADLNKKVAIVEETLQTIRQS